MLFAISINNFLLLMYSFFFLLVPFFGPKWRPPLLILVREKYFGQRYLNKENIKSNELLLPYLL